MAGTTCRVCAGHLDPVEVVRRLRTEAEAAPTLATPNIVPMGEPSSGWTSVAVSPREP